MDRQNPEQKDKGNKNCDCCERVSIPTETQILDRMPAGCEGRGFQHSKWIECREMRSRLINDVSSEDFLLGRFACSCFLVLVLLLVGFLIAS